MKTQLEFFFNKDKLPLSLNQGMLIGTFIRVAADNVTLA